MSKIKVDLHMHGPIGFQPYWLREQGYAGKNLLKLITEKAFEGGITISAITSQREEIPRLSVDDRLGILREYEAPLLSKEYKVETLGGNNNILVVERGNDKVYLVNGQTVMPKEGENRHDLLVVGSNEVPNGMTFRDTLLYGQDRGLIQIAEHPYVETHRGMGRELLEEHINDFDAIEGHNSQAVFYKWITKLPKIGAMFSRAGRELNEKAKATARKYGKPYVATSDAHRIEDLGISYIEWEGNINDSSENSFFTQLKEQIRTGNFRTVEYYEPLLTWFKWIRTFQKGISSRKIVDEYIPSNKFQK